MAEPAQGVNVKIGDEELKGRYSQPPAHHPHARGVHPGLHQPGAAAGDRHRPHRHQPRPPEADHPGPERQPGPLREDASGAIQEAPEPAGDDGVH